MKTQIFVDRFMKSKRRTVKTEQRYNAVLKSFVVKYPEMTFIKYDIEEWLSEIKGSESNLALHYSVVRALYRYACNDDGMPSNPFLKMHEPTIHRKERRTWTPEELYAIGKAARPGLEQILILTLVDSCCRIGALGSHYNTKEEFYPGLNIKHLNGNSFTCTFDKTGEHTYRLDPRILTMMKSIADSKGFIFVSGSGRPYSSHHLAQIVTRLVKRAGLTGLKLGAHTFRHTSATLAAMKSKSALVVKALLNHDKVTTSEIYIHKVEKQIQQEISPLELANEYMQSANVGDIEQLQLTEKATGSVGTTEAPKSTISEEMMANIPEGKTTRPLLKYADLVLLRQVFVFYADKAPMNGNAGKLSKLLSSWIQRNKKEGN